MHQSVLLTESIAMLDIKPNGTYIDATFGRGGHAKAILDHLGPNGRLMIIDQDQAAIDYANKLFCHDKRIIIYHASFANIQKVVEEKHLSGQIDGILADLGVSSPQLDDAARGFSFKRDGPLDMRMNQSVGQSVAEWLQTTDEASLAKIIWQYGEEKFSRRIAKAIIQAQAKAPLTSTGELKALIEHCVPKSKKEKKHPATRSFQALRIFINQELEALETFLADAPNLLVVGGRLVVISFHSLEDRIVKNAFNGLTKPKELPRGLPIKEKDIKNQIYFRMIAKKLKPGETEIGENIRARSAILRAIERISLN